MTPKYSHQQVNISSEWKILRNVFYNISPKDNISDWDKFELIYSQEDLLLLSKGDFHLDLGWYGGEELNNENTGFCIHLFRGSNWNDSELLEKVITQDKNKIVDVINEIIEAVNNGDFDKLKGYLVDENDPFNNNDFGQVGNYSARVIK